MLSMCVVDDPEIGSKYFRLIDGYRYDFFSVVLPSDGTILSGWFRDKEEAREAFKLVSWEATGEPKITIADHRVPVGSILEIGEMGRSQYPYNKHSEWIDGYNQAKEEQYYTMYGEFAKEAKTIDKLMKVNAVLCCLGFIFGLIFISWIIIHNYFGII